MDWYFMWVLWIDPIHVFSILFEPPKKLNKNFYMCDKRFVVDSILEMYKNEQYFGLIFFSGNGYEIHKIIKSGTFYENKKILSKNIKLPNQHKTGGQSAVRFSRIRDENINNYINMTAEHIVSVFNNKDNTQSVVEKIIIAGPGLIKHKLIENPLMNKYFKDKILEILDTPEITDDTIYDTINKTKSIFDNLNNSNFKSIINEIKDLMNSKIDLLLFGIDEIKENINNIKKIYICDKNDDIKNYVNENNKKCEIVIVPSDIMAELKINIIAVKHY